MTSKVFANLNPNALGLHLALSQGNSIVTTDQNDLDGNRMVLATIPKAVGHAYFECYAYSVSQANFTGAMFSVGVANPTCELDTYVGGNSSSWGFRCLDGGVYHNGAIIIAGQAVAERKCIGVYVNFNANTAGQTVLAFYTDGNFYGSFLIDPDTSGGQFLVAACSLGNQSDATPDGNNAGDLSASFNFGQRPFDTQPHGTIS